MRYDPEPDSYRRNKINVELDLSNYATRLDLKGVAGINKSKVATQAHLGSLKSDVR